MINDLLSDIKEEVINKYNITPEKIGFIFTGDITDTADHEEFKKAEEWIKYTFKELKIPPKQIAIVPGNHDVNWKDCEENYKTELQKQTHDPKSVKEQMRRSPIKLSKFADFFYIMCGKNFEIQSATIFEEFEKLGIVLIGLDTTYPSLWTEKDNYGAIAVEQIKAAREHLKDMLAKNGELISIAAMHHSLLPNLESDKEKKRGSYLHYAEDVKRWLEMDHGFDIVLCGHEHTSRSSRSVGENFSVLVTGSFGLCYNELIKRYEEGQRLTTNKYQIILVGPNRQLKFLYRKLNREDLAYPLGKWVEDKSSGRCFDKINLQQREVGIEYPKEFAVDIINTSSVKSSSKKDDKHSMICMTVNEATLFPSRVKLVKYKIEPGGEEVLGDPCCNFLAAIHLTELEGRSISANIEFENGEKINAEANIPPVYNPSDYILFANYNV